MKRVLLYSGGTDSVLLYHWTLLNYPNDELICIYYDYGNPICELEKQHLPNYVQIKKVEWFNNSKDSLISKITEPHKGSIYIPGRNLVFAILSACQELPNEIFMGGLYEECHKDATDKNDVFINKTSDVLSYVLSPFIDNIKIRFPYVENKMTKLELLKWGIDNGFTKDIEKSVSCFDLTKSGKECGLCHSCMRKMSFFGEYNLKFEPEKHPFHESEFGKTYILNSIHQIEQSNYKNQILMFDLNYGYFYKYFKKIPFDWINKNNVVQRIEMILKHKNKDLL